MVVNFVDLQKAFDTVDHNILMSKLKHCGTRGVAYILFESYLKGRKQHVSINRFNSNDLLISHECSTRFCSWTIIFSSLHHLRTVIKFCKVHHIADDTNLLHISKSIKKLNKFVSFDLKNVSN